MYWHHYDLRFLMRPIAARYPRTYKKVGDKLKASGKLCTYETEPSKEDVLRELFGIISAMPPHIKPWEKCNNDPQTWVEIDWSKMIEQIK